jgi:hypothetical protein
MDVVSVSSIDDYVFVIRVIAHSRIRDIDIVIVNISHSLTFRFRTRPSIANSGIAYYRIAIGPMVPVSDRDRRLVNFIYRIIAKESQIPLDVRRNTLIPLG